MRMRYSRTIVAGVLAVVGSLFLAGAANALEVGQKAPDFTLNGTDGKPVKLSDLTAKGPVVLYTFIAAFTGT
jgi:thioredoxin-dependent peroxiredoxin